MQKKKVFLGVLTCVIALLCCACAQLELNGKNGHSKEAAVKVAPPTEPIAIEKNNLLDAQGVLKLHPLKNREGLTPHITGLCYHEVLDNPKDPYAVPPKVFQTHIREFKAAGYNFIDLEDLRAYKEEGKPLPKNPVFISFDDGYLNNYTHMFPIVQAEKVKATVFIAAGLMETKKYMTWKQIKEMADAGIKIGCHTMNHAKLVGLSAQALQVELVDSKKLLEQKLGIPIYAIAYPCGYATPEVLEEVQKNYALGFYANVDDKREETMYTFNRYGVFNWNEHINSIFMQEQPKME